MTPADLTGLDGNCADHTQRTVIAQIAAAVFGGENSVGFYFIQAATALILILAANTAFNGFPLLSSILAQDRYPAAPAAQPRRPARLLQRHHGCSPSSPA
jgi:hypothetical protein